ncbi:PREDICTED: uncharacterized protein LOC104820009 [Tarenaya hassleriana]|uniref:uncharacterized protein LOC104820009 n=1 Tax=Tarenaya hassleriana TaxID=28532 RepID=UPI00053C5DAD|nr:PREDICTED: uncharacterized protein LOC104820009 [Tarenaya hassleriana]
MESLVANYASSDEEEERKPKEERFTGKFPKPSASSSSSFFSALPQPRNPKTSSDGDLDSYSGKGKSSSFLSSLPPPKSLKSQQSCSASSNSVPAPPKRVVQIRLPVNPRLSNLDDEDEEDEDDKKRKKRRQMESAASHDSSVKSFLSAMPAPKSSATLGVLPSSGSGRRSIIETEAPLMAESGSDHNASSHEDHQSFNTNSGTNYANYGSGMDQSAQSYASGMDNYYGGYDPNVSASGDASGYAGYDPNASASGDASGYGGIGGYDGSYGGNAGYGDQYGNTWAGGSGFDPTTGLPESVGAIDSAVKRARRGKKDMPPQIVEVKQDELMKNRPREDQVKSTGIAFGPAYQPAPSKGKPTKLHKRKHQITALYFDMKQKEMELAERRSRGLLTKAETQAKYGW